MISSIKIKINHSWKFWRNWNVPLVLLGRSWWAGFNGIYLLRWGFRMWEILIFKRFLSLKIQINSQKIRFWKEKSVEDVVTLECLPFNSSRRNCDVSKHSIQVEGIVMCLWCLRVRFSGIYVLMSSHLGQWHRPH
jgi:hypothetical protein